MKLKKEFITHTSGDEQLMISAGGSFNGMVRSNKTAAFIIDLLKEETTKEKIVSVMLETYDADEQVISADVDKVIDALRSIGAIDE
jgi:methyltransferase-like protein